jgi:peroxiredoxin
MNKIAALFTAAAVILVLSLIMLSGCGGNSCPALDAKPPDFTLVDLTKQKITLSELKGKTVVINFWATWCPYCVYELPFFQEAFDVFSKKNTMFLMIDSKESIETASRFINEKKYTFPVLVDKDGQVTIQYCVPALPGTVIIDPRGILVYAKLGAYRNADELIKAIEAY